MPTALGDSAFERPLGTRHMTRARLLENPRSLERARSAERSPLPPGEDVIPRDRSETLNRAVNVTIALIGLIISFPVLFICAVGIKFGSPGPILYTQTRVGQDRRWRRTLAIRDSRLDDLGGKVFTIFKLRTMRTDAETGSGAVWATENDPRVTRLGKFLRTYRIDEIPQLWNVLLGDMNIVGPRPERPSIVARLRQDIPSYGCRLRVKPGLTGLAQINQNYDACLDDVRSKVNWDLRYLREQDILLDLRIMVQTIPSVLMKFKGW